MQSTVPDQLALVPGQPSRDAWRFIEELQSPLWSDDDWVRRTSYAGSEVSLREGVCIRRSFEADAANSLHTAYADMEAFLGSARVPLHPDGYLIRTEKIATEQRERFRIVIRKNECVIQAGDLEGIRRAIFHLEDVMVQTGGPFLPIGTIERAPFVRTRISRCFFSPIVRPPTNHSELADERNYYPEAYLNRLAHHAVNGVWLAVQLRDLCASNYFTGFGQDRDRRLSKLQATVEQCARYGIKVYPFCIEPIGFTVAPPVRIESGGLGGGAQYLTARNAAIYPEVFGHTTSNFTNCCTSSQVGRAYLEEATFALFSAVPNLGGMIVINLGERPTHCYSALDQLFENNCPRCSRRRPAEVFTELWGALTRGMHRINPDAELISWFYLPTLQTTPSSTAEQKRDAVYDIAEAAPEHVTLQMNFESSGDLWQCGRHQQVSDYSLAYVGPSDVFKSCAGRAAANGARISAKLQVGCSHELATVPHVPVPGNLYRKYRAMRELGVSTCMQSWYFGNYPSVMTKTAGLLSFEPFPESEDVFLKQLASLEWAPEEVPAVVDAWKCFRDAYANFPASLQFSWYGPVHDSAAWPLHLVPADEPIAPSWLLGFSPSGDRIGECFAYSQAVQEIEELCMRMVRLWNRGLRLLTDLKGDGSSRRCNEREVNVARAIGIQLDSATNIIKFYALREKLWELSPRQQRSHLSQMKVLAEREIHNSGTLARLAQKDSRLGFHSEAEGYKYHPEQLMWRVEQIRTLLVNDFAAVDRVIRHEGDLFPAYTGRAPEGMIYHCPTNRGNEPAGPVELCAHVVSGQRVDENEWATWWRAWREGNTLTFHVTSRTPHIASGVSPIPRDPSDDDHMIVSVEPRRLWPSHRFIVAAHGQRWHDNRALTPDVEWHCSVRVHDYSWEAVICIPLDRLEDSYCGHKPIRINIERRVPGALAMSWVKRHALRMRLIYGSDNPADYGWMLFQEASNDVQECRL